MKKELEVSSTPKVEVANTAKKVFVIKLSAHKLKTRADAENEIRKIVSNRKTRYENIWARTERKKEAVQKESKELNALLELEEKIKAFKKDKTLAKDQLELESILSAEKPTKEAIERSRIRKSSLLKDLANEEAIALKARKNWKISTKELNLEYVCCGKTGKGGQWVFKSIIK